MTPSPNNAGIVRFPSGNNLFVVTVVLALLCASGNALAAPGRFVGNMDLDGNSITNGSFVGNGAGLTNVSAVAVEADTNALAQLAAHTNLPLSSGAHGGISFQIATPEANNSSTNAITADRGYRTSTNNAFTSTEWLTLGGAQDLIEGYLGDTEYGTTNQHPVIASARLFDAQKPASWTQTYTITVTTPTYQQVGARAFSDPLPSTNIPAFRATRHVWVKGEIAGMQYYSRFVAIRDDNATTNVLGTGDVETAGTSPDEMDSTIDVSAQTLPAYTGVYYLVAERFATRPAGADRTFTIYGGTGTPTRIEFPTTLFGASGGLTYSDFVNTSDPAGVLSNPGGLIGIGTNPPSATVAGTLAVTNVINGGTSGATGNVSRSGQDVSIAFPSSGDVLLWSTQLVAVTASITIANPPTNYLALRIRGRVKAGATQGDMRMIINGDGSAQYDRVFAYSAGTAFNAWTVAGGAAESYLYWSYYTPTTAVEWATLDLTMYNYVSARPRTFDVLNAQRFDGAARQGATGFKFGLYRQSVTVTQMVIDANTGNMWPGSEFRLYGVPQ